MDKRRSIPYPIASVGAPREKALQALQACGWSVQRRPWFFVLVVVTLTPFAFVTGWLVTFWSRTGAFSGLPWWIFALICLLLVVVAIPLGFVVFATMAPGWVKYATKDARFGIQVKSRGWYAGDHVSRPGTKDAGREIRLLVRDDLITVADEHRVVIWAHTTSATLARRYIEDIPGLRIASRGRRGRILLVRPPRPVALVEGSAQVDRSMTM
ncbi:hypothetical protein [Microbacterium sp. CH12i]|uniref:hypothetical protein n=1 Tax=Microbacterium sp. CH12i TaxID=1479651 RepID=UPI001267D871|nr:hypothetical protein [Microbacterium sp. CH12i]